MVRQSAVPDLSDADKFLKRTPRVFHRRGWVRIVELEEVDVVGLEPSEACFYFTFDRVRFEVLRGSSFPIRNSSALCEYVDFFPPIFDCIFTKCGTIPDGKGGIVPHFVNM